MRSIYSKYGNRKVTVNGRVFDSKKEANRYQELLLLEKAGAIRNLRMQVKYILIPPQRETNGVYKAGKNKGQPKPGKVLERECAYIADFVYYDSTGNVIVEDTKGFRTAEYKIKRKLMLYIHGIQIKEV